MADPKFDLNLPYLVRPAPSAMVRLVLGSACTIATLLCIPDGMAIIPKTQSFGVWLVRMFGLWLSCVCLWTFGCLALLYIMRTISRGVEFTDGGFKLWRFGKFVPWESVRAVTCESQPFFSKAFCLPLVHRMTIYSAKKRSDGTFDETRLSPHNIPSFQFSSDDFRSMLVYVSEHCFNLQPSGPDLVICEDSVRAPLKVSYDNGRKMRTVMSAIILAGLVIFLGRRAIVNYSYNMGLHEFKAERYAAAAEYYAIATKYDGAFAPAWDGLARSEYRIYKKGLAEEHWERALRVKPDYVEAKIGLATLLVQRRQWGAAEKLLRKAIQLSPTNVAAHMNLADLYIRTGQFIDAKSILKQVVDLDIANSRGRGLLARCYLRTGEIDRAEAELAKGDYLKASSTNNTLSDLAFLDLVKAEWMIARNDLSGAQLKLQKLSIPFKGHDMPEDLLLDWIELRAAQANEVQLTELVHAARKRGIPQDEIDIAQNLGHGVYQ